MMIDQAFIPIVDPNPLPAPYWIFKLLLILTFILHIVAMNLMLGSGLLALWAKFRSGQPDFAQRVFRETIHHLPVFLPATITLGVAPLLFAQVLYGQFFYASSIIMGWPWFLVLVLLTILYYGFYFASFRKQETQVNSAWVVSMSLLLALIIGFIYTNNVTFSMTPEHWHPKYFSDPAGWNLNLGEPTLIPRFLHFVVAALAVGGLFIGFRGILKRNQDPEYSRYLIQFGGKSFLNATMAQIIIGIWFFATLPRIQRLIFMGDDPPATMILVLGIVAAVAGLSLVSGALQRQQPGPGFYAGIASTALALVFMAISRDKLRDSYLQPFLQPMAVQTQWGVFPLFLVLFLGGLALWLMMMKRYYVARKASVQSPAPTGSDRE
jgi:hypothetical protein